MTKPCRLSRFFVPMLAALLAAASAAAQPLAVTGPHSLTDAAGREVVVAKPYSRIVSLYSAHTENLFALGLDEAVIGVSPSETFPPRATERPVFSYHDDPEKFLAARPDLVLIRPMIDRGYAALVRRLEKSGIAVVSLQPRTPEEMYRYWEALGLLTGRRREAAEMTLAFQRRLEAVRSVTRTIEPRQRVYFEAIGRRMKTFAPDSIAAFVLASAGGINVASDAEPVRNTNIAAYGKERILSHADEIDVYLAQRGPMNRRSAADIRSEPGFSAIRAVREGRIFLVEEEVVSRPTPRLIEGICTIAGYLYPKAMPGGCH